MIKNSINSNLLYNKHSLDRQTECLSEWPTAAKEVKFKPVFKVTCCSQSFNSGKGLVHLVSECLPSVL